MVGTLNRHGADVPPNMTDPSKLGPYMAVALLATFYGAARSPESVLFCRIAYTRQSCN